MPSASSPIRVVLEPRIADHEPQLYRSDDVAEYVNGWGDLNERHLNMYEKSGYMVIRNGLTQAEVAAAKAELKAMTLANDPSCTEIYYEGSIRDHFPASVASRENSTGTDTASLALGTVADSLPDLEPAVRAKFVRKFQGFVDAHPALKATAEKRELIALVKELAREPVRLFQDMAMIKPAGGREKPWHQDHAYFNFPLETRIVGVWIALGPVTPENGCMFVISGGHWEGPRIHFRRRDWQICDTEVLGLRQTALPMEAGDIMIFHPKLPHGTPTNRTAEHRWALQYHYVPVTAEKVDEQVRLDAFGSEGRDVTC